MRSVHAHRWPLSERRGRVVVVGGLALLSALVILAVILSLTGRIPVLLGSAGQAVASPNPGKSVLVLSRPNVDRIAAVTLLSMVRTSDGKVLWQYPLAGDLANGYASTNYDQLRAGTAVYIVNGVVYFAEVLDARPDRPALTTFRLTALRADTGERVWQRQRQVTSLEVLGISDGVLVALATTGSNYIVDALTATGYRADTGVMVWQRQLAGHTGYGGIPVQVLDGILYVGRQAGAAPPGAFAAFNARTGRPLWQFTSQDLGFLSMLTAADGVVVMEGFLLQGGPSSTLSLSGLRERDGALLWSHEISQREGFPGTLALLSFQESGGILYYVTNVPELTDLELNALQMARGTLLWHRQVTTRRASMTPQSSGGGRLVLANGMLYLLYALQTPAASPAGYELFAQAVRASDGTLGWGHFERPGLSEAPELVLVDGAAVSGVLMEASDSEHTPLIGLGVRDGATLWHAQWIVYGELVADGKLIVFSVLPPPDNQFHQHVCALQPSTGVSLWCTAVDSLASWVIVGP